MVYSLNQLTSPWTLLTVALLLVTAALFLYNGWVIDPEDAKKEKLKLERDKS